MNKYESFVALFEQLVNNSNEPITLSEDDESVIEELKSRAIVVGEKPLFTEQGIQILEYLQNNDTRATASDIGQGLNVSARKITGAIRKLITDSYVSKVGANPVIYSLTDKGRNFNLQEYLNKENN